MFKKKVNTSNTELLQQYQQLIGFVQNTLEEVETHLKRVKLTLTHLASFDPEHPEKLSEYLQEITEHTEELKNSSEDSLEVIEGIFDGYYMIGRDQKKYPVPVNYASKSKLVPGDVMKLKILPEGKLIFKLIQPIERKHLKALLSKTEDNKFIAHTDDGKIYLLNQAAVSFHGGKAGDELYIIINGSEDKSFAAIEAIIKQN